MTYRFASDGRKVSLLGYGAMRLATVDGKHANGWAAGSSSASIDQDLMNRQVKMLLDGGVNYFDTSPAYCRGESERRLGEALAKSGYDRKDFFIATKLSNFAPRQYPLEEAKKMFSNSLKFLQTDYIDFYLLHSIGNGGFDTFSKRYISNGAADWCLELRERRKIRNLGFSFHGDPKAFEWCIENHAKYKWDFCQIQMNYVDWRHAKEVNDRNLDAEHLYKTLTDRKIPVVVMEPLLGGRLARYNWALTHELTPRAPKASLARWAFRFCGTFPNVLTILSGMTRTSDIEENLATFSPLKACSAEELDALEHAAQALLKLNTIPCNNCNYCMPCPYGLDIPAILTFKNLLLSNEVSPSAKEALALYRKMIPEELRRGDHCTGCRRCNPHRPQQIDSPREMAEIDRKMDEIKGEVFR